MNQVKGTGASSTLFQHDRPNKPQVSRFDLSRKVNFSLDTGMIVPIELLETYPGDKFRINLKVALDTLPLVAPSLTNYKIVFHYYYMKKRDMWKGWKTFSTKGRSGNVNLTVPQVDLNYPLDKPKGGTIVLPVNGVNKKAYGYHYAISNHSLGAFLGVPPTLNGYYGLVGESNKESAFITKNYLPNSFKIINYGELTSGQADVYNKSIVTGFGDYSKVSALSFVMYQSICKHFYVNPNLLQDNTALFPVEGDDDWILPYTIKNNIANYISGRSEITSNDKINVDGVYSNYETDVDLRLLRYAMFDDDYFTTALKDLQRGTATSLELSGNVLSSFASDIPIGINPNSDDGHANYVTAPVYINTDDDNDKQAYVSFNLPVGDSSPVATGYNTYSTPQSGRPDAYISMGEVANYLVAKTAGASFANSVAMSMTANQMRSLLAMSVWQERNMRVDGSYNRMVYQHWAISPRSEEHVPVYIGGSVDYLNFSTVIQNSESSKSSPLGSTAGFGSSGGEGSICSDFYCEDHGYIMGVMIIKPETIYQQGVDKLLTEITFDDFAQPEFQGLSPEAILNKELYVSGGDLDNELFAYQERYTYLKVRQNVNRGLMQCKPDKDLLFSAYTQARWFNSVPKFSYQFLCMSPDNLRRDWLAYPSYPAFRCQLLNEVFVTRKLAYMSEPNTFGF